MSFKINFSPSNVNRDLGSEQVRIFEIETPNSDPDFGKHMNYFSLLCAQSNQISGMKNEIGEYVVTSGYRPFQGNFCGQCNNLSTAHVPEGMQPVTKGFLSDFEASASLGCRICQLILAAVSPYTGPGRLKAYIRPGAALNILVKSVDKNARYDLFTQIGQQPSPWPGLGQARIIAKNSADDSVIDLLRSWLEDCKTHDLCKAPSQSNPPRRILCVENDRLRLEEPENFSEPYVALSHCWGNAHVPTAIKSTMASLKDTIDWNMLTKTFQDAIMLIRKLGIHYIWIDSLCIIQDDDSDWLSEASKMGSIFEGAELVVSAAAAKDGLGGIFRDRKPVQILASTDTPDSVTVQEYGDDLHVLCDPDCGGGPIEYIVRHTAPHAQWDSFRAVAESSGNFNPLLGRAWAFQERLLATRIVHFADHELVWECKQTQRCECMHLDRSDGLPIMERVTDNIKLKFAQMISSKVSENPYLLWEKVVESFNDRALTFEKDRLAALAGAILQMQRLDVGPCIAGLFLGDMPRCLLWEVPEPCIRQEVYTAPTWSWASVISPEQQPPRVKYSKHGGIAPAFQDRENVIQGSCISEWRILKIVNLTNEDDDHPLATTLCCRGPLVSATLAIERTDSPDIPTQGGYGFMTYDAPFRDYVYNVERNGQTERFTSDLFLHTGPHELASGSPVYLLAIAWRAKVRMAYSILVLKKLEELRDYSCFVRLEITPQDPEKAVYARIGIMDILEEEAQRLKLFDDAEMQSVLLF